MGKQMKTFSGITLTILVISIMVLLVLVSVTYSVIDITKTARTQGIRTNMLLIQTKVKQTNEQVAFNGDTSVYSGEKLSTAPNNNEIVNGMLDLSELADENWYILKQEDLNSLGLEGIKLKKDEVYLVNYKTTDVISPENKEKLEGGAI